MNIILYCKGLIDIILLGSWNEKLVLNYPAGVLNAIPSVCRDKGRSDSHNEDHVKMEAEVRGRQPQEPGRDKEWILPLKPTEEVWTRQHLDLGFPHSRTGENKLLLLQATKSMIISTTAIGNKYTGFHSFFNKIPFILQCHWNSCPFLRTLSENLKKMGQSPLYDILTLLHDITYSFFSCYFSVLDTLIYLVVRYFCISMTRAIYLTH